MPNTSRKTTRTNGPRKRNATKGVGGGAVQASTMNGIDVCRQNPAIFSAVMLATDVVPLHARLQSHLSKHDRAQVELPRGHGKTSQIAMRIAWEIGHNPNIRVKIVMQNDHESIKSLSLIKGILESPGYRAVFPWIAPNKAKWGSSALQVSRDLVARDATVEAMGVFGRASGRADIIVFDDVCDLRNTIIMPALKSAVKMAVENTWLPMLDPNSNRQRVWMLDTPYTHDDLTSEWRKVHGAAGSLLCEPCIGFRSPWPEVFSEEHLQRMRESMGPTAYARAYLLEPVDSADLVFRSEWIDRSCYRDDDAEWQSSKQSGRNIAAIDWAFSEKTVQRADPDWSVCLFGTVSRTGHLYLTDIIRMRSSYPDFCAAISKRMSLHGTECAWAEANGPQAGLVQQFRRLAPCPVIEVTRTTDKRVRAAQCQAFVEQGRIRFPLGTDGNLRESMVVVRDEMCAYPAASHDDCVDAALDLMTAALKQGSIKAGTITTLGRTNGAATLFRTAEYQRRPSPAVKTTAQSDRSKRQRMY